MPSLFDCHVHTTAGSPDSSLTPQELVQEARRLGLRGAVLAEHNGWPRHDFERFAQTVDDLVLIRAIEVYTDWGHVITLGLDGYESGINSIRHLRSVIDRVGGYLILAHPFRFLFDPHGLYTRNVLFEDPKNLPKTAEEAAAHFAFAQVHELEVVNGGNVERENRFAQEVARVMGRKGTGGSDAHSTAGLAKGLTLFHGDIRNERDLLDALRAGAFLPLENYHVGRTSLYGDLVEDVLPFLQSLEYYELGPSREELDAGEQELGPTQLGVDT